MLDIGQTDLQACLQAVREIGVSSATAESFSRAGFLLVSFVFNRSGGDLDERERERLEMIRPHLGDLYAKAAWGVPPPCNPPLTPREREVLHWVAAGKTDRDIGDILAISPRTVHKHLQRIYEKLGVETRTAAVVRALKAAA